MGRIVLAFILAGCLLFGSLAIMDTNNEPTRDTSYRPVNYMTYWDDILRFSVKIEKPSELLFLKLEYPSEHDNDFTDLLFDSKRNVISGNNSIKFGKYLFTKDNEYVFVKINNYYGWLQYNTQLDTESKKYIRSFMDGESQNDFVEAIPFNDQNFMLINNHTIVNLVSKKINLDLSNSAYYEGPQINFHTDMLECTGDLSTTVYVFNKSGNLVQEIPGDGQILGFNIVKAEVQVYCHII